MSLACFLLTLLGRVVTVQLKNGSFVTGLVLEVDQHSKLRVGVSSAPPALSVPGPCVGCLCETVGCVSVFTGICVCAWAQQYGIGPCGAQHSERTTRGAARDVGGGQIGAVGGPA